MKKWFIILVGLAVSCGWGALPESLPIHHQPFWGPKLPNEFRGTRHADWIFLYDGPGSWEVGTENLKAFLRENNYSYQTKGPHDLLNGDLQMEKPGLLIMPGGESWVYLEYLGDRGAQEIIRFVKNGGSYLGICAGAFYATSHREGGAATGPYGIGLLEGVAHDGTYLKEPGYSEGVVNFSWELGNPLVEGLGNFVNMLLYGGPAFRFSIEEAQKKNIQTVLRFSHSLEPAMIQLEYGKGKVFLSAPHVEIKEEKGEKPLHDFSWPFLERVVNSLMN